MSDKRDFRSFIINGANLKKPATVNMPKTNCTSGDMFSIDQDFAEQFRMSMNETVNKFIFTQIQPFVDSVSTMEISKEELVEAVLLNRLKKEAIKKYGYHILSNDLTTATAQMQYLRDGYQKGYDAGYNRAREECIQFMSQDLKENSR